MTIEDAISHCEDRAKADCSECAEEHRRLAEWLKELKAIREYVEPLRTFNTHNLYLEELKKIVTVN